MPQSRSGACAQAPCCFFSIPWRRETVPQQNRTCCGFAWFNVLKPVRESASAHKCARPRKRRAWLSYHGAAKQPQQNRTCCGFAWFQCSQARARKRISAQCARPRASGGLEVIIPWRREAASTKPHLLRFCMVQCSQARARKRISARSARGRASGGLEVIIPWRREAASTKPHLLRFCVIQCSQARAP